MSARYIMHIDMDAFFPSVETVHNPELKGKPVIVGGMPGERGVVASASYEARVFGIHSAMPLSKAYQLCPQGIFLRGNFEWYKEASDEIMRVFLSYTPEVEKNSLDEAYLDFSHMSFVYNSIIQVGKEIQAKVREKTGLSCSVGIGSSKTIAKIASDYNKPAGFTYVEHSYEKEFLKDMEIRKIPGIGPQTEKKLQRMGIYRVGQIANQPIARLEKIFGVYGAVLWNKANGIDVSRVHQREGIKSISKSTTFPQDVADHEFVESTLLYLLDKVSMRARKYKKKGRVLSLCIRYTDFHTIRRQRTLPCPQQDAQELYSTLIQMFRAYVGTKQKIRLVGVELSGLINEDVRIPIQETLFHTATSEIQTKKQKKHAQLASSLDKIRAKYGFDALQITDELRLSAAQKQEHVQNFSRQEHPAYVTST